MAAAPAPNAPAPTHAPSFADLGVPAALCDVLARTGITEPFPIQAATLPDSLAGRDVLGRGRTGSGKTLAFVLPLLARLAASPSARQPGRPRALVLAPTRELVTQIYAAITPLAQPLGLRAVTVFGGVSPNPQINGMRKGVDVVVACPGRLEDLMGQGHVDLGAVEITVLDEADHMADLGFLPGVKRLMDRTPRSGQRLLFSATLDNGIDVLVKRYLSEPVTHSVDSAQSPVVTMTHHVLHVTSADRLRVLVDLTSAPGRTMVFTRTKHRAKQLAKQLNASGVPAVEMHGNLAQNTRTRNLAAFSEGRATALVATDIAARGIHVDDVSLVIHADPPIEHKAYLHRSGRTARAGNEGTVVTLATEDQRSAVKQLARKAGIDPFTTRLGPGDPLLAQLAPGDRTLLTAGEIEALLAMPVVSQSRPAKGGGAGGGKGGGRGGARRGSGGGQGGGPSGGPGGGGARRRRKPASSAAGPTGGARPARRPSGGTGTGGAGGASASKPGGGGNRRRRRPS